MSVILRDRPKASVRSRRSRSKRAKAFAALAGFEAKVENHEPDTHVVLFTTGIFGRGFNSPRLHHNNSIKIIYLEPIMAPSELYVNGRVLESVTC